MYAVIQTGGKQYRVAPGDTIRIERVSGDVGEKVTFGSVLAVHTDEKKVMLGSDASKVTVTGKIVSQGRAKKLTVLKFKKGNQYKISRGHRQNFTAVQGNDIKFESGEDPHLQKAQGWGTRKVLKQKLKADSSMRRPAHKKDVRKKKPGRSTRNDRENRK